MSLTAFRPYSTAGDTTTSTSAVAVLIPANSPDVLVTATVDTWISFGNGTVPAVAGTATVYIPAKVPCLFSLNSAWTVISVIAGGAGKCNFVFGAQA